LHPRPTPGAVYVSFRGEDHKANHSHLHTRAKVELQGARAVLALSKRLTLIAGAGRVQW
jgi:hypothetical protein